MDKDIVYMATSAMNWIEIVTLCSCLVTILGSPIAFALYLGNKMDAIRKDISEESKDFHSRLSKIEEQRKSPS